MMMIVFVALALVMGAALTTQGLYSSALASRVGTGAAIMINTILVGIASIGLMVVMKDGPRLTWSYLMDTPPILLLGGVSGFVIITLTVILFPRLGAGTTMALAILAQLVLAVIVDHYGMMGIPVSPVTVPRIAGIVLLVAGAALVKFF